MISPVVDGGDDRPPRKADEMMGTRATWRVFLAILSLAFGLAILPSTAGAAPALGAPDTAEPGGWAHGGTGTATLLGNTTTFAPIAPQHMPCTAVPEKLYHNEVLSTSVGLPPTTPLITVLSTGSVVNQGILHRSVGSLTINESSTIQSVLLLDGAITADAVTTKAAVTYDATGVNKHTSTDDYPGGDDGATGFSVVNLQIAGQPVINGDVPPNTLVDLPGLGHVVLNEQAMIGRTIVPTGQRAGISVNGIHVVLDVGGLGNVTGDIVIAHAQALIKPHDVLLSGAAWAAKATVDPIADTGRIGLLTLPCDGSDGVTIEESTPGINVTGGILTSGTATATVMGDPVTLHSHSTETIQGVNALSGTITAEAIQVVADTQVGLLGVVSTGDMTVVNLQLPGLPPINGTVGKNTTIGLPGIGTVVLNGQKCRADLGTPTASLSCTGLTYDMIQVTGIRITILEPTNPLGLPVGAIVEIAMAKSDAHAAPGSALALG